MKNKIINVLTNDNKVAHMVSFVMVIRRAFLQFKISGPFKGFHVFIMLTKGSIKGHGPFGPHRYSIVDGTAIDWFSSRPAV